MSAARAEVRDEISSILHPSRQHDAYLVPRRNYMMGRWIKGSGWYPNFRQPQLFRKGAMRYTNEPVHEGYSSSPSFRSDNCKARSGSFRSATSRR